MAAEERSTVRNSSSASGRPLVAIAPMSQITGRSASRLVVPMSRPAPFQMLGGNLFQEVVIDVISDNFRERRIARERIPAEKSSHRLGDGNVFGVRLREHIFQGGVVFRPEEREWRGERAG